MKRIKCCEAYWDSQKLENCPRCRKRLEPPKGSIPASCCQTRGAGLETSAVTNSDTASPLPDQGWGGMALLIKRLEKKAAGMMERLQTGEPEVLMESWKLDPETAADLIIKIDRLKRMLPRTQSVADGGEWCRCETPSVRVHGEAGEFCRNCALPMAPPSRKERSVSGNAKGDAPT